MKDKRKVLMATVGTKRTEELTDAITVEEPNVIVLFFGDESASVAGKIVDWIKVEYWSDLEGGPDFRLPRFESADGRLVAVHVDSFSLDNVKDAVYSEISRCSKIDEIVLTITNGTTHMKVGASIAAYAEGARIIYMEDKNYHKSATKTQRRTVLIDARECDSTFAIGTRTTMVLAGVLEHAGTGSITSADLSSKMQFGRGIHTHINKLASYGYIEFVHSEKANEKPFRITGAGRAYLNRHLSEAQLKTKVKEENKKEEAKASGIEWSELNQLTDVGFSVLKKIYAYKDGIYQSDLAGMTGQKPSNLSEILKNLKACELIQVDESPFGNLVQMSRKGRKIMMKAGCTTDIRSVPDGPSRDAPDGPGTGR